MMKHRRPFRHWVVVLSLVASAWSLRRPGPLASSSSSFAARRHFGAEVGFGGGRGGGRRRRRCASLAVAALRGGEHVEGKKKPAPAPKKRALEVHGFRAFDTWVDRVIGAVEAPLFDLSLGLLAITLTIYELTREVRRLGYRDANWALLVLSFTRCLKSVIAVLRNTKTALRGYRAYTVVNRGKNVYLRHVPEDDTQ